MMYHELTTPNPSGPASCATCGCRLAEVPGLEGTAWRHFQLVAGQDARGCRTACLTELHRRDGTILPSLEHLMHGHHVEDVAAA